MTMFKPIYEIPGHSTLTQGPVILRPDTTMRRILDTIKEEVDKLVSDIAFCDRSGCRCSEAVEALIHIRDYAEEAIRGQRELSGANPANSACPVFSGTGAYPHRNCILR